MFLKPLTVAAALALALPAAAQTWDMPTPYPDATFHTQNIRQFAEDVSAATDGKLAITVHSAGSLFPHGEIKNAVRSRQVPIGEFLLSLLSNEDAAFGLDAQPFLATSYEGAQKLWLAQKPVITELLAKQDLVPLYAVAWPPQGLYTRKEIAGVSDLSGLRFRAYNAQLEEMAVQANAAPVQIEVPDIPQAFATGQVEAMITSSSTGVNSKAWDFLSHFSPINAWLPKNVVVVNKRVFDGLDDATRAALLDAAAKAEARGWEMSRAESVSMMEELKTNGITVYEPSAELRAGLEEIGVKMLASWEAKASAEAKAVVAGFRGQ